MGKKGTQICTQRRTRVLNLHKPNTREKKRRGNEMNRKKEREEKKERERNV